MTSQQSHRHRDDHQAAQDLLMEWAWKHVEAAADGSLNAGQQERMQLAMQRDQSLAEAVKHAVAVHGALQGLRPTQPRPGLWLRLWAIPAHTRTSNSARITWVWAAVPLLLVILVTGLIGYSSPPQQVDPTADLALRQEAIKDFNTAMHYVQKSAAIGQRATRASLGGGIQRAFSLGLNTWIADDFYFENGD